MPQLDTSPWFSIYILTWFMFLALAPSKVLNHNFPFQPLLGYASKLFTRNWNWPWL